MNQKNIETSIKFLETQVG